MKIGSLPFLDLKKIRIVNKITIVKIVIKIIIVKIVMKIAIVKIVMKITIVKIVIKITIVKIVNKKGWHFQISVNIATFSLYLMF